MTRMKRYPEAHTLPIDTQERIKAQFRRDLDEHARTVEYAIVALTTLGVTHVSREGFEESNEAALEHICEEDRDSLKKFRDMLMKGIKLTGIFLSEARNISHKYVEGPLFEIAAWREGLVRVDEVHT